MDSLQVSVQPTADGIDTLFSANYGQTYHSTNGALIEAEFVFLRGTGLDARLTAGLTSRVLEVGFGTGLNFWATVQHSFIYGASLEYVSLEKDLLPAEMLARLNHKTGR